ncbi:hypothetical protein V1525DRAFT_425342 [Lipomyces kononenkoae]|uniref:Uncharacterized protein n=1 Tax=Lipomyces kononenkoae TaxID=34357 RepID=A0ACC3T3J5_LIPKO
MCISNPTPSQTIPLLIGSLWPTPFQHSFPQPQHSPLPFARHLLLPLAKLLNFPTSIYPCQGTPFAVALVAGAPYSRVEVDLQNTLVPEAAAVVVDWLFVQVMEPWLVPTRVFPDFASLVRRFLLAISLFAELAMVDLLLPKTVLLRLP